jgi:hypothetical protein
MRMGTRMTGIWTDMGGFFLDGDADIADQNE